MYNKSVDLIKNSLSKMYLIGIAAFLPLISFADVITCEPGKICNPIPKYNTINDFIKAILEGVLKLGIPIIALAIIYSGFLFVTAQGNTEKLTRAKNALLFSVVGAALVLGAWALAQLISETVLSL
jgi:hypothetical protein